MITTKVLGITSGILFVLLLIAMGTAKWQHRAAQSARAERDSLEAQLGTAVDANKSNLVTVNAQANALQQWKKLGRSPEEVASLVANAREREKTYNAVFAENKMLKDKDNALPECVKLLQMRVDRLCPGRAVSMRLNADRYQNGHGGSPGAGRGPLATGTHQGLRTAVSLPEG